MNKENYLNTIFFSDLLKDRYPVFHEAFSTTLIQNGFSISYLQNTNDIWCRDYMPVPVPGNEFVQFQYEPSYLKPSKYRKTKSNPSEVCSSLHLNITQSNIILDGGNVIRYGNRIVLTDRLLKDNKGKTKQALLSEFIETMQADTITLIPALPNDFTGHADGMVQLINEDHILVNDFSRYDKVYFTKLLHCLTKNKFHISLLPWDAGGHSSKYDDTGDYINFLKVGQFIFLPEFKSATDDYAKKIIQNTYPAFQVIGIDCRAIAKEGGLLHCCTWHTTLN